MNAPETISPPADAVAVASLPVAAIVASPSNPRKRVDDAYIADLADSIRNHGLIQPITVRPLSLDAMFAFNRTRIETDERQVNIHEGEIQPPHILLGAAALVNLDANAFREPPPAPAKVQPKTAKTKAAKPASTPVNAARAGEIDATAAPADAKAETPKKVAPRKAKAKADPAPASPANEPAAPVKTHTLNPAQAWPFPLGNRP